MPFGLLGDSIPAKLYYIFSIFVSIDRLFVCLLQVGIFTMLGLMHPFSDMDRAMADRFVMAMTTGRPWVQTTDSGLKVSMKG